MESIALFNAVPLTPGRPAILPEWGVIVEESAGGLVEAIRAHFARCGLSERDLNATSFFRSWATALTIPDQERLAHQLLHYMSTYGLAAWGIDAPHLMYLPGDRFAENAPERVAFRVIRGVPPADLIRDCLAMLAAPAPLKQETILSVLTCLTEECGYRFTGRERIGNREAAVIVADRAGVLPADGDALLRWMVWKATGSTLIIKSRAALARIRASGFVIPPLTAEQERALAERFLRLKPIFLAFKAASGANAPLINRLRRLARVCHRPVGQPDMLRVTSGALSDAQLARAIEAAPTRQIVRALNAVRAAQTGPARLHRVRNGRAFARCDERLRDLTRERQALEHALAARAGRIALPTPLTQPPGLRLTWPVSEKQMVGALPWGTRIHAPRQAGQDILIGIHWQDARWADLDLSAIRADGLKIGWNADWRQTGIAYSGDVTRAENGASEWLIVRDGISQPWIVLVNYFSAPDDMPFRAVVGYGSDAGLNYMIDPNNVIASAQIARAGHDRQIILGVIFPDRDGVTFALTPMGGGKAAVSIFKGWTATAREAIVSMVASQVMLDEALPVGQGDLPAPATLAQLAGA